VCAVGRRIGGGGKKKRSIGASVIHIVQIKFLLKEITLLHSK